jgi:hypothetical protein
MTASVEKQILILAGPNGAGKTTFAREFLVTEASCPTFLNADIIAAELSPQHPEQVAVRAARFMLQRIREESVKGESFAFETTLANRSYAHSTTNGRPPATTLRCGFWRCRASRRRLRAWLSAYFRVGTISARISFAVALWPEEPISTTSTGGWPMPGCFTTIPRPSRSC